MAGTPALAQPPAQPTVPQRAEPLVVTATKDEIPLEQIGASVTIVTEETFAAQQYRTVDEVLRTVPGVDVQTSGSPGKFTSVRIRGANAAQIQVLIDGVRVKSTTSGDFDFADLTLDDVQRIEVVRGPQSTVYGADAIGGVINIITKRGQGKPTAWFDFEAGNYETFRERAGVSGEVGAWNFSLGASRLDFGGQFDNDEHDVTSFNGRVGYALPNNGEVALIARYSDAHRGIPFETVFPNFSPRREQDDTLAAREPGVDPAVGGVVRARAPAVGHPQRAHLPRPGQPVRDALGHRDRAPGGRLGPPVPLRQAGHA